MSIITKITNAVASTATKASFAFRKNSPSIAFAGGLGMIISGAVLACKETLKVESIIDDAKEQLEDIHNHPAGNYVDDKGNPIEYTEKDIRKDTTAVYLRCGARIVKNYLPALLLISAGCASLIWSHTKLVKTVNRLSADLATVTAAFAAYRDRVKKEEGNDADFHYLTGAVKKKVEQELEDGTKIEKEEWFAPDQVIPGAPYSFVFSSETTHMWDSREEYLRDKIKTIVSCFNNQLQRSHDGHLFLNDVLIGLGLEACSIGQDAGWMAAIDPEIGNDGFIQCDIKKIYYDLKDQYGHYCGDGEFYYILTFNCDGDIRHRAFKKQQIREKINQRLFNASFEKGLYEPV